MKNTFILLIIIGLCSVLCANKSWAQEQNETVAYKMAIIQTRNSNPETAFLSQPIKPDDALISEFKWIMDSLRYRCLDSEESMANTILEAWQTVKKWGQKDLSLLETARTLSAVARNRARFGQGKVSFRSITSYWLSQQKPKKTNTSQK